LTFSPTETSITQMHQQTAADACTEVNKCSSISINKLTSSKVKLANDDSKT